MTQADIAALRDKLAHEVTRFDSAEEAKAAKNPRRYYHNVYALGLYLGRVDSVIADVAGGTSLARALYDNFQDRLLTRLEKACGLPVTYEGGSHDTGRPT